VKLYGGPPVDDFSQLARHQYYLLIKLLNSAWFFGIEIPVLFCSPAQTASVGTLQR
jgi:hypothetical protein